MRAVLRPLASLGARDVAAWRELAEHAVEPNPFWDPDLVLPAARHLGASPAGVLVAGDWEAALPVAPGGLRREVLLPGLRAWRHEHCFLTTPLVAPGAKDAVGALARAPRSVLVVDWLGADGPVAEALRGAGAIEVERFARAVVRRRAEPHYADLSGARRKKLRRQARALARELGGELTVEDVSAAPAAVEEFLVLEGSGWKGREGTALAARDGGRRFLREACAAFAARGALQVLALRGGGRTAAMQVNFRAGDALFAFKVAMDEALARHSPGAQLELLALEEFHHRTDAAWIDSCASPDADLVNRLWPDRRPIGTLVVPGGGPVAALARPGVAAARVAWRARARLRGGG